MDTWTCHICGEERPDSVIAVLSYPMKDFVSVEINVRYCSDKPNCLKEARKWKAKGKFPSYKREVKKPKKKWWEVWKGGK